MESLGFLKICVLGIHLLQYAGPGPERLPPSSCPRRALQTPGRRGPHHLRAGHPGIEEGAARPDPGVGALNPKKRLSFFLISEKSLPPGMRGGEVMSRYLKFSRVRILKVFLLRKSAEAGRVVAARASQKSLRRVRRVSAAAASPRSRLPRCPAPEN